jgi:ABC-type branched-subunit amino acid transport system substrate-binding protein
MAISDRRRGLLALVALIGLLAAACSSDGEGTAITTDADVARTASDTGVTADTIRIGVAVSDLDGLRAGGISLPAALTTTNLSMRVTSYFDEWNAAGGINGRMVEPVVVTWDPTKPATQDQMCAQATVDNELFAVINATGLNNKTVDCLLAAGMLVYFGDFAAQASHDSRLLLTIAPPVEIGAEAGTTAAIEAGDLPRGATIGVLAGNGPDQKAGAAAAKAVLEGAGYAVQEVEINTLQGDTGAINQESAVAAGTFRASGVSHVLMLLNFTNQAGFFDAAGGQIDVTVLDTSASNCTAFGASRTPPAAVGGTCITTWDSQSTAGGGLREETAFEAECRAHWDEVFASEFPTKSSPGVPSGQVITLADGTELSSDYDSFSCTLTNVLKLSLEGAGVNPTRASAYEAALGLTDVPVAMASDGKGSYGPAKTYLADFLHPVTLTAASLETPKDANGTYNGCVAPVNCWVPNSDEWFPIES